MSIRSFSSELKHNLSQTYDIFNDLKIIKSNGVCKGAYNQFERLPSCDQIQKVFRRQIRFIRHSLQEFSFPDLLITPLGKPLEEIINLDCNLTQTDDKYLIAKQAFDSKFFSKRSF